MSPGNEAELAVILQKAGERVAALFQDLPSTTSTEEVRFLLRRERPNSESTSYSRLYYRYLLLVNPGKDGPLLQEYRTSIGETPGGGLVEYPNKPPVDFKRAEYGPFFATRLIALVLNFLPQKQAGCQFRYLGRDTLNEREMVKLGFSQIPDANPEVSSLRLAGKSLEMPMKGVAWFDASTYEILRIQGSPLTVRHDLHLDKLSVAIDFKAVPLGPLELHRRGDSPATFQLPVRAVVDVTLAGQPFRMIHDYSDYKVFRADSRVVPADEAGLNPAPTPGSSPAITMPPAAPSAVNDQSGPLLDPWYSPLRLIYSKSKQSGPFATEAQRELNIPWKDYHALLVVAARTVKEDQGFQARMKAITDAEQAANPLSPEMQARAQEHQDLLAMEVARLKSELGPHDSARLDAFVQQRYGTLHFSSSGRAPARKVHVSLNSAYSMLFSMVTGWDSLATDKEELEDRDGTNLRDRIRNDLGFSDEQFAPVRAAAERWAAVEQEYYARKLPAKHAFEATFKSATELKALGQERVSTINNEIAALRRTLGPEVTAKVDAHFRSLRF